jgi:hypothetical protein
MTLAHGQVTLQDGSDDNVDDDDDMSTWPVVTVTKKKKNIRMGRACADFSSGRRFASPILSSRFLMT